MMKTKFFFFMMLAFFGLSSVLSAQSYDYVVADGGSLTLSASDYGQSITIGVPNGGDFELWAVAGSTGWYWTTENSGTTIVDHILTDGSGTYSFSCDQGSAITIEIIWYVELDQPGEDFFEIVGSDTTITISSNFVYVQWGEVGQTTGTESSSMGPMVPGKRYWVVASDASWHDSRDTCTISQATVPSYDVSFTVSSGGEPVEGASVSIAGGDSGITDADGVVSFDGLADGNYNYSVTKAGYYDYNSSFIIDGAGLEINVMFVPVGLDEMISSGIFVYPNPVGDILIIDGAESFKNAEVVDMAGHVLFSASIGSTIDFSMFQKGLYFLKLTGAKKSFVTKVIKE